MGMCTCYSHSVWSVSHALFSLCLQAERLVQYQMEFSGIDPDSQKPKLIDADGKFSKAVGVLLYDVAQCFDH